MFIMFEIQFKNYMKTPQLISSLALCLITAGAVQAQWTDCATGTAETRVWDGGGSTQNWSEAANWSGDSLPDCNDNVVFDGTSSKNCIINVNTVCRDIIMKNSFTGRVSVASAVSLDARNVSIVGTRGFVRSFGSNNMSCDNLSVGDNGLFSSGTYSTLNVHNRILCEPAGYFQARSLSTVNCGSLELAAYSQFKAPETGFVFINRNGGFSKHKKSTFDHKEGTVVFTASSSTPIELSSGMSQSNGACSFYNVVVDMNGATNALQLAGSDTAVILNRLTILSGSWSGGGGTAATVRIMDTLEFRGAGNAPSQAAFRFEGNGTKDLIMSVQQDPAGTSVNYFDGGKTIAWAGTNTDVRLDFASVVANGAELSCTDDEDVVHSQSITVNTGGLLTLPASENFTFNGAALTVGGTIAPQGSTFTFGRNTGNTVTDFTGGAKTFNNVVVNMPSSNGENPHDLIPTGNNDTISASNIELVEGDWRNGGSGDVLLVTGDFTVGSAMTNNPGTNNNMRIVFRGNGNGNYNADGVLNGDFDILVDKAVAANVTVGGNSQLIGSNGGIVNIISGNFAFDGSGNATLRATTGPGLIVGANGTLTGPDDDELTFTGSWDVNSAAGWNMQACTFILDNRSTTSNFAQGNRALRFYNFELGSNDLAGWGLLPGTSSDTIWAENDFFVSNSGARMANVHIVVEGDYTSAATSILLGTKPQKVIFTGSADQVVSLALNTEMDLGVRIDKSAGKVTMNSEVQVNALELASGNIVTGSNRLNVIGINGITGGSSSSFVDGKLRRTVLLSSWSGGVLFPVGKGSDYRPARLRNITLTNTWDVEYFASNPKTTFGATVNSPLDDVSTAGYWTVQAITVLNILGSGNTNVSLSTNGSSFSDANTRVARWTGSAWANWGPSGGAASGFVQSSSTMNSGTNNFTLGVDNPAPNRVIAGEEMSGNDGDATSGRVENNSEVAATAVVPFSIYPNPASDVVNLRLPENAKGVITLSDLNGKVYGSFQAGQVQRIQVSHLSSGMYLLSYSDGLRVQTQRFVKQ